MKTSILLLLFIPIIAIANDYEPFKEVKSNEKNITLMFKDVGAKFSATYKDKIFMTNYGQEFNINVGDTIILSAKHVKYTVTATSFKKLNVQYNHNFQGKSGSSTYAINFK